MTDTDIDDLLKRAGEVLEGVTPDWEMDATGVYDRVLYAGGIVCVVHSTEADARFIAWCREGVPALLAQNAALRAERDEWRKLESAAQGLSEVLDQHETKGPLPDTALMFCWLAAQNVRAVLRGYMLEKTE